MPRTLVFGSVGDHTDAVASWLNTDREYALAIAYYGNDPSGHWARSLQQAADYFIHRKGGKFQNLLFWADNNCQLLTQFEYILIADDDIVLTPEMVARMARTAREYDLPVSSASHSWNGKVSSWGHMMARGSGRRTAEYAAGVEFCNFVEMTCPLLELAALWEFIDLFRNYAHDLTGWGADWIIASACYTDARPFGVMHNVSICNSITRPGLVSGQREIDLLQPTLQRKRAWLDIVARNAFPLTSREDLRIWLPRPRMRCINLDRATERRERFTQDWIEGLKLPVRFFSAVDRREIELGRLTFPSSTSAALRKICRPLTSGEIACAASHALVMHEETEFCGPEGVFIMEDDCYPIPGANAEHIGNRIREAVTALPGVEAIACHKPHVPYTIREAAGGAERLLKPPWGSIVTWYSPQGLRLAFDLVSRMDCPADWIWRDFSAMGKFAMLRPPVAWHDVSETTYIGNEHRGVHRRFIE